MDEPGASTTGGQHPVMQRFLVVFWLSVAVLAFVLPALNPGMQRWTTLNPIYVGLVALGFAAFNLVRLLATRPGKNQRQAPPVPRPHRREQPTDPNFDFSDREEKDK
jgi:hypothetical protein